MLGMLKAVPPVLQCLLWLSMCWQKSFSVGCKKVLIHVCHSFPDFLILGHAVSNSAQCISSKYCSVPWCCTAGSPHFVQNCFTACLLGIQHPAKLFTWCCGQEAGCLWHVKWNSVTASDVNKLSNLSLSGAELLIMCSFSPLLSFALQREQWLSEGTILISGAGALLRPV